MAIENKKNNMPLAASLAGMCIILFVIFPYYRYNIDPDSTAYLTISARYASGDFSRAINGYWSPWSCWVTAILIRLGMAAIPAAIVINTVGAGGFLAISDSLFKRFDADNFQRWVFNIGLSGFLCYAIFAQAFDDLWECGFLLLSVRLMLAKNYRNSARLWLLNGIIGALAYFAKSYSFPFFIINTVACSYLLANGDKKAWVKFSLSSILVMVACSFPWIYLLHDKYGIWTTSTAGSLNMSWYLVGHPYWKEGIDILLPPTYPDSPYYWEDPFVTNGATPHFWDSWNLFQLQITKIGLNLLKLLISGLQLSVFFPVIIIVAAIKLLSAATKGAGDKALQLVTVSFLLFPCGYLLINFESRYIWFMMPLALVIAIIIAKQFPYKPLRNKTLMTLLALSLLAYPLRSMKRMYNVGKAEYEFAQQLKAKKITGSSMISNLHQRVLSKIAYFSGNRFFANIKQLPENYTTAEKQKNTKALLDEAKKYKATYYLYSTSKNNMLRSPDFDLIFNEDLESGKGIINLPIEMVSADSSLILYRLER